MVNKSRLKPHEAVAEEILTLEEAVEDSEAVTEEEIVEIEEIMASEEMTEAQEEILVVTDQKAASTAVRTDILPENVNNVISNLIA